MIKTQERTPGVLPASVAKALTRMSGNILDWSRFGINATSSRYRYSWSEILTRVAMSVSTLAGTYYAYINTDDETPFRDRAAYTVGGFMLSLTLSHVFAMPHLLYKRIKMSIDAEQLVTACLTLLLPIQDQNRYQPFVHAVYNAIKRIKLQDAATETRSNASLTLGKRVHYLRLAKQILEQQLSLLGIGNDDEVSLCNETHIQLQLFTEFWQQSLPALNEALLQVEIEAVPDKNVPMEGVEKNLEAMPSVSHAQSLSLSQNRHAHFAQNTDITQHPVIDEAHNLRFEFK